MSSLRISTAMVERCSSFFFSSRRRHTRYWRDWSSDVCSSDLVEAEADPAERLVVPAVKGREHPPDLPPAEPARSEERRVGKECRSRWLADHEKKKRSGGKRSATCARVRGDEELEWGERHEHAM